MASLVRYGTLDDERVSSDIMDEKRQENIAYEYLCHLEEIRVWIEACTKEKLPPATELEEQLRNGVHLAKLAHFVAPAIVPVSKIYDLDQTIYETRGLQFRHTENINHWFSAMKAVGMPSSCQPETFDIYDKRNMPKAIYCLHAFSMFLFKKGLAPKIEDMLGKLTFTDQEIEAMQKELDKNAVQMPSFKKIGGILPPDLPLDVAALHASVIVINKALEKKNSKFLESLQNPHTHLHSVVKEYEERYKQGMVYSKKVKIQNNRRADKPNNSCNIYDELLSQEEIQQCINEVNEIEALDTLDIALTKADLQTTMKILKSPHLGLLEVEPNNKGTYLQLLLAKRDTTIENNNSVFLSTAEVQGIILQGNKTAREEMNVKDVMSGLNKALEDHDMDRTFNCLKDKHLKLPSVIEDAKQLYYEELSNLRERKQDDLLLEDVLSGVKITTAITAINSAITKADVQGTFDALETHDLHLEVTDACKENYFDVLQRAWQQKNETNETKYLTREEIQESIGSANENWRNQIAKDLALSAINLAVSNGNVEEVYTALMNRDASILCVDERQASLYLEVLKDAQHHHSTLSLDIIQREIIAANKLALEAHKTAVSIIAINMAIKDHNVGMLLEVLEKEEAFIGSVKPELVEEYFTEFLLLQEEKMFADLEESCDSWLYFSFGEHDYYFNCNTFEYQWEKPVTKASFLSFLQHHEIQEVVSRVNHSHKQKKLMDYIEPVIVKFQGHVRRYLFGKEKESRFNYFVKHEEDVIKIQRWWRNCINKQKKLKAQSAAAQTIQTCVRKWLLEKRHQNRMLIFKVNEEKVKNFQRYWRAKRHLQNLKKANPKLAEVWMHIPLLISSTRDNIEEIEFHQLRAKVVHKIRKNKELEQKVNDMDVKIGLIVRNRITNDVFAKEGRRASLLKKESSEGYDSKRNSVRGGLTALNKETRTLLENYQHLFYALQTDSRYLAKLLFAVSSGQSFIESVINTLFTYGSTPREEYLLFLLFKRALEEEFRLKVTNISDVTSGNMLLFKMVINYNHSGCRQSNLRKILEQPISNLLMKEDLYLGVDPVEIYRRWINKEETETMMPSSLPCDVSSEEALKFPQVVEEIEKNLNRLKQEAAVFVETLCSSVGMLPYGIRYIAKLLFQNLKSKFPGISEEEMLKSVGNLYYRYINTAIISPDLYGMITLEPGNVISAEQRNNLGAIGKVLHCAASFKVFENSEKLADINDFIFACHKKFSKLFTEARIIEEPHIHFDVNMYTEEARLTPPTVTLTLQEIFHTHELLCTHEDFVAPDPSDKLHRLLKDVGTPENLQSLFSQDDNSSNFPNSEVCLFLINKFSVDSGNPTIDSLLVETKRMVIHLLQCQQPRVIFSSEGNPVASLWDTIRSPASEKEEKSYSDHKNYSTFFQKDIIIPIVRRIHSIGEFKEALMSNLHRLELAKYVTKENHYQDIIDKLHQDIFHNTEYRKKRREDIKKLKEALTQLEEKTEFYQSKLKCYEDYMKNCLGRANPVKKPARRLTMGSSQENQHPIRKKYSAHKLMEKGILQEINLNGIETRSVFFEIAPSGHAGIFNVTAKFAASQVHSIDISIQDLLQKQYEGEEIVEMFGAAKLHIESLLLLLNTKF